MNKRVVFVSYASGGFTPERDALCRSAKKAGFDDVRMRGPENLDPVFVEKNKETLSQTRGGGYWLWKPQIILQELRSLNPDEVLVYSDAGRSAYYRLTQFPKKLVSMARTSGFLLGPTIGQHGPMAHWAKRDAFVLLNSDQPEIYSRAPIQATWSLWTHTPKAFEFLESWLAACTDPRILTDKDNTQGLPNLPGFRDHRHDQAALSLLAFRCKAPHLDYRNQAIEKILLLRPQSRLANLFLKRIDDAEALETGDVLSALWRAWRAIKEESA